MHNFIRRATPEDHMLIAHIGRLGVESSHRESCSAEDMNTFLSATYSDSAIAEELKTKANIYHLIYHKGRPAGFSKIILDAKHPNIPEAAVTKLDRIYLLETFFGKGHGKELLGFNIELSKQQGQQGMWLFTWVGNTRAIRFYRNAGFEIAGSHRFKVSETHYNEHHQMLLMY
jgi:ribosomal protein S18 acetylase RimI-like enzyme